MRAMPPPSARSAASKIFRRDLPVLRDDLRVRPFSLYSSSLVISMSFFSPLKLRPPVGDCGSHLQNCSSRSGLRFGASRQRFEPELCESGAVDFQNCPYRFRFSSDFSHRTKTTGFLLRPSKRRLRPKLCELAANLQIFDLAKKIKRIVLRPAKQCLRPKLRELAANRPFLATANMEHSGERRLISKGGLFTRFQIAIRGIRSPHRPQDPFGAQGLHRMDTIQALANEEVRHGKSNCAAG